MDKALPVSPFLGRFKRIIQSLRPKELQKVAVSRPMAKQWQNCAEESNLRKKGVACKTPNSGCCSNIVYIKLTAGDAVKGIQVTLSQMASQMPSSSESLERLC